MEATEHPAIILKRDQGAMNVIHAIKHSDWTTHPRTAITYCGERLILPEWTGTGWTSEPQHTLDPERVTCPNCR